MVGLANDFIIGGNVTICRTLEFTESQPAGYVDALLVQNCMQQALHWQHETVV